MRDPWAMLPPLAPLPPPKRPWHPAPPLQNWPALPPLPPVSFRRSIPRRERVPPLLIFLPPTSPDRPPIFFQNLRHATRAPAPSRLSERYTLPTTIYFYVRAATFPKPPIGLPLPDDVCSKVQSATIVERFERCGPTASIDLGPETIVGFPSAMRYNRSAAPFHLVLEVPTHSEYPLQSPSIEGSHLPIQPFASRLFAHRPSGHFVNMVLPRIVVPAGARLERVTGLRWERVGHAKPAGTELTGHAALAAELGTKTAFSAREWQQRFAPALRDLHNDHFIRGAGNDASYYRPVDAAGGGAHNLGSPFRSPGSRAPLYSARSPSYSEPPQRVRLQSLAVHDQSPNRPATSMLTLPPPRAAPMPRQQGVAPRQLFGDPALES